MKYKYKVLIIENKVKKEDLEKSLNDLGKLGWELVSMDINAIRCLCVLRRKKIIKKG